MATIPESSVTTYERVKRGFSDLGYVGGLLCERYQFADVLSQGYFLRTIPLAAFAQEPTSYRNACFGVVFADGQSGSSLVADYRSLGAPYILEIQQDKVNRWGMTAEGSPQLLQQISPDALLSLFTSHKRDWAPDQMLRTKCLCAPDFAMQLDFYDVGLLPIIETQVQVKLDQLLRRTVVQSISEFKQYFPDVDPDYPGLIRLIFRLVAAKVLGDRLFKGNWLTEDPRAVIEAVEDFYFKEPTPYPVLQHYPTQRTAWDSIRKSFHFQNLSVEALAYVYENTFVTKELRQLYSIHSTPPNIAEYIVRNLPFEDLEQDERTVFEPFSGHAVFLVATMRRLRELLPSSMSFEQRHAYFVERLTGIEREEFAWEVGRLSLMLADYPNPDGWKLIRGDAFLDSSVVSQIAKANVVLCNPPFERFNFDERSYYGDLHSVYKPAEILMRIISHPQRPKLLGFVLPRTFISGRGYRDIRALVGQSYKRIELLALPERVFRHSNAESVLLIASGQPNTSVHIISMLVREHELHDFELTSKPNYRAERDVPLTTIAQSTKLWVPPLSEIWDALRSYDRLGAMAEVHRGIEYNIPLKENRDILISLGPQEGFAEGLDRVSNEMEPFLIGSRVFLNTKEAMMRGNAYLLPWDKPKVIANAVRLGIGPWRIAAMVDYDGLVCYQNFHGIWPHENIHIEVLAALLNGPIANAYLWTYERRHNQADTIESIPVPKLDEPTSNELKSLVRRYIETRKSWLSNPLDALEKESSCRSLLMQIDAVILKAYNLPPKLERKVLDCFQGYLRIGPVEFRGYYLEGYHAKMKALQSRIPSIDLAKKGSSEERTKHQLEIMDSLKGARRRANTTRIGEA